MSIFSAFSRSREIALLAVPAMLCLSAPAQADCSHHDFDTKVAQVNGIVAAERTSDPKQADVIEARKQAILGSYQDGDIVGLGHACGMLDDIIMKDGK